MTERFRRATEWARRAEDWCARHHPRFIVLAAIAVPPVLFLLVRPDWFYIQNGVDPFFYVGYVQNLGEIVEHLGDRRYFITRWTLYLPERLLLLIVGSPSLAFLLARWIGASIIVGSILYFLRARSRSIDALAISVLVLLMPMTIRGLMTEYVDAVALPIGVLLLVVAFRAQLTVGVMAVLGVGVAIIMISYPYAAIILIAAFPFWVGTRRREISFSGLINSAVSAVVVVCMGFVYFRWHLGIPNVYQPTIDFMREVRSSGDPDSYRSPDHEWLGRKLWVYLPLFLLAIHVIRFRTQKSQSVQHETAIIGTLGVQYLIQAIDQFVRGGMGWELSYAWSFILPAFVLSFAVVVSAAARAAKPWVLPVLAVAALSVAAASTGSFPLLIHNWLVACAVMLGTIAMVSRTSKKRLSIPVTLVVIVVFVVQLGSPRERPILTSRLQAYSSYESVYDQDSEGILSFRMATWFGDYMRTLSPEQRSSSTFFVEWASDPWQAVVRDESWFNFHRALRMTATYGAFVSGRFQPLQALPQSVEQMDDAWGTYVLIGRDDLVTQSIKYLTPEGSRRRLIDSTMVPHVEDMRVSVVSSEGE